MKSWWLSLLAGLLVAASAASQPPPIGIPCVTQTGRLDATTTIDVDLPPSRHVKNVGGSDGAGLCVFTSITHAFDWHHACGFYGPQGWREWMRHKPGGGYPEKVTRMLDLFCQEKNLPKPDILQDTTGDLDLIEAALKRGHYVSVTYARSPTGRYGGQTIAHMVNCVAARCGPQKAWAIMDNNYPGSYEWMTEAQFKSTFNGNSGGWSVIVLRAPPPPLPSN